MRRIQESNREIYACAGAIAMVGDQYTYDYDVFSCVNERWPRIDDRIFPPGSDVYFANSKPERNYRCLRGYKRAGDLLIQNALTDISNRKNLIFPAFFSYRHYIELALKATIEDHGEFAGVSLTSRNHELPELWGMFVKICKAFDTGGSDEIDAVGKCINDFINIDPRSTAFRYGANRDGNIPPLLAYGIDLIRVHDVMNGIEKFFECCDMHFTRLKEEAVESFHDHTLA